MSRVPVTVLTHGFLKQFHREQSRLSNFTECWNRATKNNTQKSCRKSMSRACPARYGISPHTTEYCHEMLKPDAYVSDRRITKYKECLSNIDTMISPCLHKLIHACQSSNIAVLKTVRISMNVVERLLQKMPDLKVIHYMRDPRSLAQSRLKHQSFRGLYAGTSVTKTAQLYCQDALSDIKLREMLRQQYPKSFYSIFFEELATFPTLTAQRIYDFLERPLPSEVRNTLLDSPVKL